MSTRSTLAAMVAAVVTTTGLAAQTIPAVNIPASPRGLAAVQVAGTWAETNDGPRYRDGKWITVDYSRPILRGRQNIFGSGADYGRVVAGGAPLWRAGANATTRLTTQTALRIGGTTIQPGVYNVFVDLKPNAWTLVLSTQPIQEQYNPNDRTNLFGAYNYDPKFDVLRAPMTVGSTPATVEQFTIDFVNVSASAATLVMAWETTLATIPFTVAD